MKGWSCKGFEEELESILKRKIRSKKTTIKVDVIDEEEIKKEVKGKVPDALVVVEVGKRRIAFSIEEAKNPKYEDLEQAKEGLDHYRFFIDFVHERYPVIHYRRSSGKPKKVIGKRTNDVVMFANYCKEVKEKIAKKIIG